MQLSKTFTFENQEQPVSFIETLHVTDGVDCDVYSFVSDESKDLGIIRINPGSKTPLQKVLKGDRTIEGYISGKGKLTVMKSDGKQEVYTADGKFEKPIDVKIGELMQWKADPDSELITFGICFPPYEDGRYENIS
jgi:hypothetical protein